MDWLSGLVVLGVLVLLLVIYGKWKQQYWARKGIPQLKPSLAFGDIQPIFTASESLQDFTLKLYNTAQTKGMKHLGIYNLWMPEYMPIDLDIIKNILTKDFSYFNSHGVYHHKDDDLSEQLFTLEGEVWRERRIKMAPTFTSGKMRMMFEILLEKADVLRKIVDKAAEVNEGVLFRDVMARFATDIIASIAFGLECNTLEQPEHKFREIGRLAFKPRFAKVVFESIFNYDFLVKLGYTSNPREVKKYFKQIVKETIEYRESNDVHRNDFMQLLLELKKQGTLSSHGGVNTKEKFSEKDVINEAYVFFLGGFETSSSTTMFAFMELAQHPNVQEKLREEIVQAVNKNDGKMTFDLLMELEYLDKVVRETMRLYPVLADLPRYCTKSYKVPDTDVIIEKGTRVHIPVIGIHRDPKYYPNPDEFDPENFSPERKAERPKFTWMPFGEGPRMCIGMRFGMIQTKLGIATIVKDFNLILDESTKVPFELEPSSVVFTTKQDILLKVSKL